MLKIYWADASGVLPNDARSLSEYRRRSLKQMRHELSRRRSLCAELLLIEAIRNEDPDFPLPLQIEADAYGKPFLSGGEYEFNLSHSGRFAACALSDRPVGLDIQVLSQCPENLVRRCFAQAEQDAVFSSNDLQAAFTRLWCRKESYLKRIGQGLRLPLASFDVSAGLLRDPDEKTELAFAERRIGELFFCVCMDKDRIPSEIEPIQIVLP